MGAKCSTNENQACNNLETKLCSLAPSGGETINNTILIEDDIYH